MGYVAVFALCILLLVGGYNLLVNKFTPKDSDLELYEAATKEKKEKRSFRDRTEMFGAKVAKIAPLSAAAEDTLRMKLWRAGLKIHPAAYNTISIGVTVFFIALGFILATSVSEDMAARATLVLVFAILGILIPRLFLTMMIRHRAQQIEVDLPGVLEMLSSSMSAGLTIERGFQFVSEKTKGPLAEEFALVNKEIRVLGYERAEALAHMSDRCNVGSVSIFCSALIQASHQGAPISRILKGQAKSARDRYFEKVQEKANKAPTKMLFPLIFLIMPCMFIVVLAPALINVFAMFGAM